MRIAFIGLKGLPGSYSGIETHVHELGTRLVGRGHEVVAYVRPHYTPRHVKNDQGIRLIHLPTIHSKHLDASVHSFLAAAHSAGMSYDIVHFHTIGPACFAPLSRLGRASVVTTIHRMDYLSGKWGWFARGCLRAAETISLNASHRIIAVSPFLRDHYHSEGYPARYIPNGVTLPRPEVGSSKIGELGLAPNSYILYLGRLVPEKQPDWLIRAFQKISPTGVRLVICGGSSATDGYVQSLHRLALGSPFITFTGPVYGCLKDELLANARAFVLPSRLEGLPITLLEAMSHRRVCLVSDIPPHADVVQQGINGFLYRDGDFGDLGARLQDLLTMCPEQLSRIESAARETVAENFSWESVVGEVEALYQEVLEAREAGARSEASKPAKVESE